jgi:NADPH2:quinone reductase
LVSKGVLKININQRFALGDLVAAHEALTGRKTTGSTILIP